MKKRRDPGRGQLHRRGARVWRDEDNPTGPMRGQEEEEQPPSDATVEPDGASVADSGPSAGGATESADRAEHHEGLHGGPSRKP